MQPQLQFLAPGQPQFYPLGAAPAQPMQGAMMQHDSPGVFGQLSPAQMAAFAHASAHPLALSIPVTPAVPAPAPAPRPQQPIALHTRKRARVATPNASAVDDTEAPDTSNDHGIAAALAEEEESTESTTGTRVARCWRVC
jgi:hypothetical protein